MNLTSEKKETFLEEKDLKVKHQNSQKDTGSTKLQIIGLTFKINHLTRHLKENKKDCNAKRNLMILIGRRKRLLKYLKEKKVNFYLDIIADLGIRK